MRLRRIYDARHCGFDLPAIVRLRGTQARRAGKSNPYRPAPKVRYVQVSWLRFCIILFLSLEQSPGMHHKRSLHQLNRRYI